MQLPQERFTLKQVADSIRKTIESRYNRTYWVTAEMHKLNQTRKGHCYPELVQKEGDQIVVEMRGTIWKNTFESIQRRFADVVREPLRDGMELLFQVRIVYHPIYNLGLEIIDIDPNYTLGALQRERQETLEKLMKEGVLNANQQLKMATVPKRLAIISQADSKGYSDFTLLLNGHPKKYRFDTFLFEATLQGDAAISSIIGQLERIRSVQQHFDAVVIIRGGGGEIGMHCYNNYALAHTLATFPLPVLTGIGHSTNLTVCEMIAFNNGITPSDLAYYFLRLFEELDEPLDTTARLLPELIRNVLKQHRQAFGQTTQVFQSETRRTLQQHRSEQTALVKDFSHVTGLSVRNRHNELHNTRQQVQQFARQLIQADLRQLHNQVTLLGLHAKNHLAGEQRIQEQSEQALSVRLLPFFQRSKTALDSMEKQLQLVDPIHVLRRGYSIVTNGKGVLNNGNQPVEGEEIRIIQADFTVIGETKRVIADKNT